MSRTIRVILLAFVVISPIVMYYFFIKKPKPEVVVIPIVHQESKPNVALIFDDLGESLAAFKEVHSLGIPVTVSIIPGLRFSSNIAYIAARSGIAVMIHLPMAPKAEEKYATPKYTFISARAKARETDSLLRYYLNSIRVAIGVNNHMGSDATEDPILMRRVLRKIKSKNMFFVDSHTSQQSVACDVAGTQGVMCARSDGFLDAVNDAAWIDKKLEHFVELAGQKGKIIIIGHPKPVTLQMLRTRIPELKKKVNFITMADYFER
ncbi:MAG: divergent polysaccharide deacetylase family protein [Candidatus Omnitrophota bacterium]|nr:divergent polysaccharide deacetylase family protein [Candidatus Omnitrophota bacterium]